VIWKYRQYAIKRMVVSFLVMLSALGALVAPSALAQVSGRGVISGTISDPSNARIANATVVLISNETDLSREVKTDKSGSYSLVDILPGPYTLQISAEGFSEKHLSGLIVTVGASQILDVSLGITNQTDQVQVSAQTQDLATSPSEVSGFVTGETIRSLPLNGQSWFDLALLQPGVVPPAQRSFAIGSDRGTRGFGSQLTISGARPQQNNYLLNGTSLNDYANDSGSVLGANLGVDAISEFRICSKQRARCQELL